MGLEKTGDIVREAYKNNYGVAAFNIFNYETIKFAVEAADRAGKPVIVQLYPGFRDYISFEATAAITKDVAGRAKVPVGLHLDHCTDVDLLKQAMQAGFLSVMYDGSRLSFEENIRTTQEAVKAAKEFGADLEAELGSIGSASDASSYTDASKFTDPQDALEFCGAAGVSSLAVAVGNAHGSYAVSPNLDFPRIREISGKIKLPLVLHGGSGIPDGQLREAVKCGVAKINVATEYFHAFYKAAEKYMGDDNAKKREDIFACMRGTIEDVSKFLIDKMEVFYEQRD